MVLLFRVQSNLGTNIANSGRGAKGWNRHMVLLKTSKVWMICEREKRNCQAWSFGRGYFNASFRWFDWFRVSTPLLLFFPSKTQQHIYASKLCCIKQDLHQLKKSHNGTIWLWSPMSTPIRVGPTLTTLERGNSAGNLDHRCRLYNFALWSSISRNRVHCRAIMGAVSWRLIFPVTGMWEITNVPKFFVGRGMGLSLKLIRDVRVQIFWDFVDSFFSKTCLTTLKSKVK
jgi:hypothetical protein